MLKKLKKLIETQVVGRYEDLEKRYLAFEDKIYNTLDQRLNRLEAQIDALSQALRQGGNQDFGLIAEDEDPQALDVLNGLGPVMVAKLAEQNINKLEQIAALQEEDLNQLDLAIKGFKVRCLRYRWVEQAQERLQKQEETQV